MKRFVYKVGILLCLIGVFVLGINYIYRKSMPGPEVVPKGIQIANVGSSHAYYGLCYDDLQNTGGGYECFNFALSGQVPSYDVRMLEMYQENLAENGICFIPVSWFSFVWQEEKAEGFEAKNSRYYAILDRKYMKDYSLREDIRYHILPGLYAGDELFKMKLERGKKESFADQERTERWYNTAEGMNVEENAVNAYQGQVSDWNNVVLQEEVDAVYKMITICKEKHVTPILLTFPFTREFNDCSEDNLKIIFYDVLAEIVERTGIQWYDYSNDSRFVGNKELFMDSNHLNIKGANYFTKIIKYEIIEKVFKK